MEHLLGYRRLKQNIQPSRSRLELLPLELRLSIVSYLDVRDVANLSLVNTLYRNLMNTEAQLISSALASRVHPRIRSVLPRTNNSRTWLNHDCKEGYNNYRKCDDVNCILLMGALIRTLGLVLKDSDSEGLDNLIRHWERVKSSEVAWIKVLHRLSKELEGVVNSWRDRQLRSRYSMEYLVATIKRDCMTGHGLGMVLRGSTLKEKRRPGRVRHDSGLYLEGMKFFMDLHVAWLRRHCPYGEDQNR